MTVTHCEPQIRQTLGGRWQASTPPTHRFRIGVVGDTRDEAEERFRRELAAWEELDERAQAEAGSATEAAR